MKRIKVGYVISDNGMMVLNMGIRSGKFYEEEIAVVLYPFGNESEMNIELFTGKIDMACMDVERVLFEEKGLEDVKVISEFKIGEEACIGLCVGKSILEEETDLLFGFVRALNAGCKTDKYIRILSADEWLEYYVKKGYDANIIMKYLVPDFPLEALSL